MRSIKILAAFAAFAAFAIGANAALTQQLMSLDGASAVRLTTSLTSLSGGKGVVTVGGSFPQTGSGFTLDAQSTFFNRNSPTTKFGEPNFTFKSDATLSAIKDFLKEWTCTTTLGNVNNETQNLVIPANGAFNITCPFTTNNGAAPIVRSVYSWAPETNFYTSSNCVNVPTAGIPTAPPTVTWEIRGPAGANGTTEAPFTSARVHSVNFVTGTFTGLKIDYSDAYNLRSPSGLPMFKELVTANDALGSYYDWYAGASFFLLGPSIYLNPNPCAIFAGVSRAPLTDDPNGYEYYLGDWMTDGTMANMWTGATDFHYWTYGW